MNNFWQRTITGIFFIGSIIWSIVQGPVLFQAVFLLVSLLSLNEFYRLVSRKDEVEPNRILGLLTGLMLYIVVSFDAILLEPLRWQQLIYPLFGSIFFAELYRKKKQPFHNIAFALLGIVYTVLPFGLLSEIASFRNVYNPGILLGYFVLIWTSDTFAYLIGRKLGKTRLFERISPKKSWEGSVGGALAAMAMSWLLGQLYADIEWWIWTCMAIIIVITGTLGDLTESLLKRSLGVKDSGNILPGHGGMLDRFDAILLSAPFVWAFLSLLS